MPLTYRHQKGAPLTVEELDGNFKELEARIQILENHTGETLGKIELEGDQLSFMGSLGTHFGTFTLPKRDISQAPPSLSIYEKETLPTTEHVGCLAILMNQDSSELVFFDGKNWNPLLKGDIK